MPTLGQLERSVMETLWNTCREPTGGTVTGRTVAAAHPELAYTTVLTVLDRLAKKGLVEKIRDAKTHRFRPTASRESFVAEIMQQALSDTQDRAGALVHFLRRVRPEEAKMLRAVLEELDHDADQPRALG